MLSIQTFTTFSAETWFVFDLKGKGIKSNRVLEAMTKVPRHLFVPHQHRENAYADVDLPISQFLTTPRPLVVAKTIELLNLKGSERVLEVGTGKGYQTALLAELAREVYSIEIVPDMGEQAQDTLKLLNYKNAFIKIGDGFKGWPEHKPFDAILVMASVKTVPGPLLNQLKMGGRLVIPIQSDKGQSLVLYRKALTGLNKETVMEVQLKPMEGRAAGHYWD